MYPLWDIAIAPIIRATAPRRIVEIGALRGETTVLMLESLGSDVELHVIDPVPEFDPAEHEKAFPGRYLFYRDISHNVLPELPPLDVALVDGDHNWYTVYHELKMLREGARRGGAPLPVLVMHDVLWPYGRRDLYYAPERIPEEFRQPYAMKGMRPGESELVKGRGGVNAKLCNALHEGGPRNGVMTAFDDFVAEHDRALRTVLIPIYFGLLIVADEDRLAASPELVEAMDRLESLEVQEQLLRISEDLRLQTVMWEQQMFRRSEHLMPNLQRRYLDALKGSLLNDHYPENEARLDYLLESCRSGNALDEAKLVDPARNLTAGLNRVQHRHAVGASGPAMEDSWRLPFAAMGRERLEDLESCLDTLRTERVAGDLFSCGSPRGGDAVFMAGYVEAHEWNRRVWAAYPLKGDVGSGPAGAPSPDPDSESGAGDLNLLRGAFDRFGLLGERVKFVGGVYRDSLPGVSTRRIALLRVEAAGPDAVTECLEALYDRVVAGGYVIVDTNRNQRILGAVERFRDGRGVGDQLERLAGAVRWRKTEEAAVDALPAATPTGARIPLAPTAPKRTVDLSVVVVVYNMKREAERSLHALSRAYQQGIDDLDYEVIVVENGSADDQVLGEEYVRSFGREFRYLNLGENATPSPVHALNRGIAMSRGTAIALMIDGAHILTPGVLRYGVLGLHTYGPSAVAIQQWYVGPGQQPDVGAKGYDQEYEDQLFRRIAWPADGYRLFQIGHFIGDRDWLDGMSESNCLFVPRAVLEQIGGFDETFSVAGGGYANLELYERIGTHPGLTMATVLGEGSFHQVHGGTTTNQDDIEERNRRLVAYREHYAEVKGRDWAGIFKPIHYLGSMNMQSRRTRARRLTAQAFFDQDAPVGPDGVPAEPFLVPDELRLAFTDGFWRSLDWRKTSWLGAKVEKCPTDLLVYQELVHQLRPDWIVETGTGPGGRALFLASICDLVGHGRVLSIDAEVTDGRPEHDRITYLTGDPNAGETVAAAAEIVGESPNAMLILGLDTRDRLLATFDAYVRFVPVGSYVVFEDTIVHGNPVWPGFGPGPLEAVRKVLKLRRDFAADPAMERFGLTFNPTGFLRRLPADTESG